MRMPVESLRFLLSVIASLWLAATVDAVPNEQDRAATSAALHRIRTGHFIVEAEADGHSLRLVVDTACPVTVIGGPAFRRLDLPPPPHDIKPLRSLNGRPTGTSYLSELKIGGTSLGGGRVAVAGLDAVLGNEFAGGGGADGILGTDLLARRGAVIDIGRGTISFNPTPTRRAEVAQRAASAGYTAVPMAATSGGHFAVACIIRNNPGRLVVDTGSPYTVVQRGVVAPEALASPGRVLLMHTLAGSTAVSWVSLEHWSIGAFPITRASIGAGSFQGGIFAERTRNGGQVVGLLGLEWLAHWSVIIDFGSRVVYLRHP